MPAAVDGYVDDDNSGDDEIPGVVGGSPPSPLLVDELSFFTCPFQG